jgi:hypothetical protein
MLMNQGAQIQTASDYSEEKPAILRRHRQATHRGGGRGGIMSDRQPRRGAHIRAVQ